MIHLIHTHFARTILLFGILLLFLLPGSLRADRKNEKPRAGASLNELLRLAWQRNPRIAAARARVAQARAAREKLLGFFDPLLSARMNRYGGNLGSTFETGGEARAPFRPGFYLDFGAAEDRLSSLGSDPDGMYQTVLSARIEVPLLRDLGFRQWHYQDAGARAFQAAAKQHLLAVEQAVRHQIEQRYIAMLEADTNYRISHAATGRVERLLQEAKELVRLKVVPEYQLFVARMEVSLARASEREAREAFSRSVRYLLEAVGLEGPRQFHPPPNILVRWANAASMPPRFPLAEALLRRGDYREQRALSENIHFQLARARDELRPDLTLSGEIAWQEQDAHVPLGRGRLTAQRRDGSSIMLTWSRPLGYRGERAELSRQAARLREQAEVTRGIEIAIRTALNMAWHDITAAREQLALVTEAVSEAQGNLAAEAERFRLGQSRSRNVLDAQKDLTNAIQRQSRTAAALLRALSDYLYAAGYPRPLASPPAAEPARRP